MSEDEEEQEESLLFIQKDRLLFWRGNSTQSVTSIQVLAILSGNQSGNQTGESDWSVQS